MFLKITFKGKYQVQIPLYKYVLNAQEEEKKKRHIYFLFRNMHIRLLHLLYSGHLPATFSWFHVLETACLHLSLRPHLLC